MKKVENGTTVKVHYTGKFKDGNVFDTSLTEGREPLEVVVGETPLIQGFTEGLLEMTVGEKKTIEIEPARAYGDIIEQTFEVPKDQVPAEVKVGEQLQSMLPTGQVINVEVKTINEETVIVEFINHPLAGKDLVFDLELVEIL